MAKIGDRVLAQWVAETQWWYPGVVCGVNGDQVEVQYDDGDRAEIGAETLRPLDVGVGSRVYCRWKGGPQYYPGKVSQVESHALHIDYDDGDKEWTSVCMVRVNRNDLG